MRTVSLWADVPFYPFLRQLARTRAVLQAPEAGRVSEATMADVLAAARRRVAARRG